MAARSWGFKSPLAHHHASISSVGTQAECYRNKNVGEFESGDHMPTIPTLQRILRVLDEQRLIGIERRDPDGEIERKVAPVPERLTA